MLRTRKYNIYKHIGLNYLFNCVDDTFDSNISRYSLNNTEYMSNMTIKDASDYEVIKEIISESYILKLNDILLIHLKDNVVKEFEFLYKKSKKYVFDIYETSLPSLKHEDTYIKTYHIFCVSKKLSNDINYMSFLHTNDSDKKYSCLSLFYGPCLIVNRRFDITSEQDKHKSQYKFIKTIGKGDVDYSIRNFIKSMISMIGTYQKFLPPHYLKLN